MTEGWKARRILNGLGFELSVTMLTNEIWGGMHSPYLSALDFWHSRVWNLDFDELDFFQVWTGFLQATQTVKIQFKLGKKSSSSKLKLQTGEFQKSSADRLYIVLAGFIDFFKGLNMKLSSGCWIECKTLHYDFKWNLCYSAYCLNNVWHGMCDGKVRLSFLMICFMFGQINLEVK